MEENANKLHFKCTDFNSPTRVAVYAWFYMLTEYLYYLSIRRHSYFLQCWHCARSATAGPPVNLPVTRKFFNRLLTPRFIRLFSGNISVNLFAVYPFKYKLLSKSCPRR